MVITGCTSMRSLRTRTFSSARVTKSLIQARVRSRAAGPSRGLEAGVRLPEPSRTANPLARQVQLPTFVQPIFTRRDCKALAALQSFDSLPRNNLATAEQRLCLPLPCE